MSLFIPDRWDVKTCVWVGWKRFFCGFEPIVRVKNLSFHLQLNPCCLPSSILVKTHLNPFSTYANANFGIPSSQTGQQAKKIWQQWRQVFLLFHLWFNSLNIWMKQSRLYTEAFDRLKARSCLFQITTSLFFMHVESFLYILFCITCGNFFCNSKKIHST